MRNPNPTEQPPADDALSRSAGAVGRLAMRTINACFANVQWEKVERRFEQAQALHRGLVGVGRR